MSTFGSIHILFILICLLHFFFNIINSNPLRMLALQFFYIAYINFSVLHNPQMVRSFINHRFKFSPLVYDIQYNLYKESSCIKMIIVKNDKGKI